MNDTFVKGQLTLDIPGLDPVGSLDEAMELWEYYQDRTKGNGDGTPPNWEYLGSGGTRVAYKSPTGVCYKVCYEYDEDDQTYNEVEHKNMQRIRREGKLPNGWKPLRTYLHVFESHQRKWDYHMRTQKTNTLRVVILACDYIEGQAICWLSAPAEMNEMHRAFAACGLTDTGGANAIRANDGTYYVIDAAEFMAPE